VCQSALCQQVVRCEAISICTADGTAEPAPNSCAREAQQQLQLPARAEEQMKQERRANYSISQRVYYIRGLRFRSQHDSRKHKIAILTCSNVMFFIGGAYVTVFSVMGDLWWVVGS